MKNWDSVQSLGYEFDSKMWGIQQITVVELAPKGVYEGIQLTRCTSVSGPSDSVANFIDVYCHFRGKQLKSPFLIGIFKKGQRACVFSYPLLC